MDALLNISVKIVPMEERGKKARSTVKTSLLLMPRITCSVDNNRLSKSPETKVSEVTHWALLPGLLTCVSFLGFTFVPL